MTMKIVSVDVVDEKFLEKVFGKPKENLKTSPNKDFTAQSVSPKVCPYCNPNAKCTMSHNCQAKSCCPICKGKPS